MISSHIAISTHVGQAQLWEEMIPQYSHGVSCNTSRCSGKGDSPRRVFLSQWAHVLLNHLAWEELQHEAKGMDEEMKREKEHRRAGTKTCERPKSAIQLSAGVSDFSDVSGHCCECYESSEKQKKRVKYFEGFLQNGRGSWSGLNNQVPYSKQPPQQIYALGIQIPFMHNFTAQVLLEDVRS